MRLVVGPVVCILAFLAYQPIKASVLPADEAAVREVDRLADWLMRNGRRLTAEERANFFNNTQTYSDLVRSYNQRGATPPSFRRWFSENGSTAREVAVSSEPDRVAPPSAKRSNLIDVGDMPDPAVTVMTDATVQRGGKVFLPYAEFKTFITGSGTGLNCSPDGCTPTEVSKHFGDVRSYKPRFTDCKLGAVVVIVEGTKTAYCDWNADFDGAFAGESLKIASEHSGRIGFTLNLPVEQTVPNFWEAKFGTFEYRVRQ